MEFLLGLLTGLAIGFIWGVWRATQSFIERIIERPDDIKEIMERVNQAAKTDQSESQSQSQTAVEYTTEWHNDVCYLYDNKGNFMAQGNSVTEAMERAEKRFPGLKLNFRIKDPEKSNQ